MVLYTNDGDLIRRLTNWSAQLLYHVTCAEKIKTAHIETMLEGVRYGDGMVKPTKIEFVGDDPRQVAWKSKPAATARSEDC